MILFFRQNMICLHQVNVISKTPLLLTDTYNPHYWIIEEYKLWLMERKQDGRFWMSKMG